MQRGRLAFERLAQRSKLNPRQLQVSRGVFRQFLRLEEQLKLRGTHQTIEEARH
jgi:hypothetical protein